jgi:Tfp pilus assembly protein PilF
MSDFDWSERFPDMRPVRSAPPLVRINGIGCGVYGSRDADAETGTYVTTYCFSVVFLPVLALTAYRVANAPSGGWYFLGRVPLSTFARSWNLLVLLAIVATAGMIGWDSYTHTIDYVAGRRLAEADALAANGQVAQAAPLYRDVASGRSTHAAAAGERLNGLLDDPLTQASLADAAEVYRAVIQTRQRTGLRGADLEERGLALLDKHADKEPHQAVAFLDVLRPLAPESAKLAARRQAILERAVAHDPKDVALVSELALLYEANNQLPRCEAILLPIKDRLGESEGARILGQILVRKDKIDDACALLEPYTERKLQQLRIAEAAFNNAMNQLFANVNTGKAPGFPYERLRAADEAGRRAIQQEYFQSQLQSDPALKQAFDAYQQAQSVVSAALDLGMILIRRAQMRGDVAAREADLKRAEKVFLALQNEKANEARLGLGQVYYWLGKHAEGHKKFEEVLAADQRAPKTLSAIAHRLREVGERGEANSLLEEAYNKEPDKEKKFDIALSRAVLAVELDDKLTWLQRANPADAEVKASLGEARAKKAIEQGKPSEAEPYLRQTIDLYAHMPESAATLNNAALAHLTLYSVTGDRQLLNQAEKMFDKAASLEPQNSILLLNAVHTLLNAAVRDVIGGAIDLTTLKKAGDRSLLSFLYDDRAGQRRLTDRFRTHPATKKATRFLERLLILAPKNPTVYRQLVPLYEDEGNLDKLRDVAVRLEKATLDLSAEEKLMRDLYAGKRDEKTCKDLQAQVERYSKRVEKTSKGKRTVTYAVAATELASLKMELILYGVAGDADEVVSLAESAYQAAPSFATRGYLEAALLFRAGVKLAGQDAAYAALEKRTHRALSPSMLIASVLQQDGKLRSLVVANADVQRAIELIREAQLKAPDVPNPWAWAMLRAQEQEAAKIAEVLRDDTLDGLVRGLNVKLYPFTADTGLRTSWALRAVGKDKEAAEVVRQYTDRGVPMP